MKRYIYTLMLVFMGLTIAQAQRMLPDQIGLEVSAGTLSNENPGRNYYLNVGLNIYAKNGNYQLWALEYNHEYAKYKDLKIPLETYIAEGGYSFFLLGDSRKIFTVNAGLTAAIGFETFNRGEEILYDGAKILNEEGFIYGAGGRLSFEIYLSNHLVFLIQARAKMLWNTSQDQFRPSAGLGVRYNL